MSLQTCVRSFRYMPTRVFEILGTNMDLISCCVYMSLKFEHGSDGVSIYLV